MTTRAWPNCGSNRKQCKGLTRIVNMIRLAQIRPKFERGQLVCHKRYGYRGVIVDCDLTCTADETWYQSNKTQPGKSQPWYHVLVDATAQNTYAAEENLQADPSGQPVGHPLVGRFFGEFVDGRYIRNDQPWPS